MGVLGRFWRGEDQFFWVFWVFAFKLRRILAGRYKKTPDKIGGLLACLGLRRDRKNPSDKINKADKSREEQPFG
jgi:hypothetical protein